MTDRIRTARDGGVCRVWLGRPTEPALDYAAIVELTDVLVAADEDPTVRAVALLGAGEDFCAGEHRDEMGDWPARYADRLHTGAWAQAPVPQQELLRVLWRLSTPTVAVIGGAVSGFGLDLACACDTRIADGGATFRDGRVADGQPVATGITYLLPRLIGLSQAERVLLLGATLDADEAQRIGLVSVRAADGSLHGEADELLAGIAGMATRSYALIKRQLVEQLDLDHDTALLHSLAIRQTHRIEDVSEGIAAFREKRPPSFRGR